MAFHSSILAWRISWTEKPGRLQSIGSHRVGHHWSDLARMQHSARIVRNSMAQSSFISRWLNKTGTCTYLPTLLKSQRHNSKDIHKGINITVIRTAEGYSLFKCWSLSRRHRGRQRKLYDKINQSRARHFTEHVKPKAGGEAEPSSRKMWINVQLWISRNSQEWEIASSTWSPPYFSLLATESANSY